LSHLYLWDNRKKIACAWLANSRVDVCKHSYFPLLLPIFRFSAFVIALFYEHFSFSQTCTRVYITRCKHGIIECSCACSLKAPTEYRCNYAQCFGWLNVCMCITSNWVSHKKNSDFELTIEE
jgi:hypothetical protein